MIPGSGTIDPDNWVREQEQRSAELAAQADRAQRALSQVQGTARSADTAVTVSVNATGQLQDLQFSRQAERLSPQALRASILGAYQHACAAAAAQTEQLTAELFGEHSETMDLLRQALPTPPQATTTASGTAPGARPAYGDDEDERERW